MEGALVFETSNRFRESDLILKSLPCIAEDCGDNNNCELVGIRRHGLLDIAITGENVEFKE